MAGARDVEIEWVVADLRHYQPVQRGFDAVLVAYLHLPEAERKIVLANAVNALAPDGVLLVIGHDEQNLRDGVGGPQDPALLYSPAVIAADLVGLRVTRAERVRRAVAADAESGAGLRQAIDTVVHAVRD